MAQNRKNKTTVLSEEFLMDLFRTCMMSGYVMEVVYRHLSEDFMPDRSCADLLTTLKVCYKKYKDAPSYSTVKERLKGNKSALNLLNDIFDTSDGLSDKECVDCIEEYIQSVQLQKAFQKATQAFNTKGQEAASQILIEFADWKRSFSITGSEYTNICDTFESRFRQNRLKTNSANTQAPICRFYIDALDVRNGERNLRTQLTCIMASTGVGKSHAARWIGSQACKDGLNVLHIQLEGSKEEIENAYSAAICSCNAYNYERGTIRDAEIERLNALVQEAAGKLYVRCYPKFNQHISTLDIQEAISEFKKTFSIKPDVVIIDSMDLLTDASGRKWGENGERLRRIAVANDLKDLASDENVWMVVTYQATIVEQAKADDENFVLTEFNAAESKGISRPLTHLITLNQSRNERNESTMRLYVAKSRFFTKGDIIKIAVDYDNEVFYDRVRTVSLPTTQP